MKIRLLSTIVTVMAGAGIAMSQSSGAGSFADFRKGLLEGYNSYRSGVLERYDKFLDGVWTDFEQFKGEESSKVPKPAVAPVVGVIPADSPKPADAPKPVAQEPVVTKPVVQEPVAPTPVTPSPTVSGDYSFEFYSLPVQIPMIDLHVTNRLSTPRDFASQWRELAQNSASGKLIEELKSAADAMNLNDYLRYELVNDYVDQKYAGVPASSRMALKHFVLVGMGYDVRIGLSGSNAVLLIPFRQTVYARTYMMVDGRKYYIFTDKALDPQAIMSMRISTCELPKDADTGSSMDLRLNGLNLPVKPHHYELAFKDLKLEGDINANIFPILYHYPQMPTSDFARSTVLADVRRDVVAQFKSQLAGKDELQAVNELLQFVQGAFEYATDEAFHGFEKPYFLEETLYYPKCDCEDRAIFYTYLLWNVLGVENQLINFPGHESASVRLSQPIQGDAYVSDGVTYYISDPTYIGSKTGMCMPSYTRENPGIDYTYGR